MKWIKQNPEKSYQEAVNEWLKIEKDKNQAKNKKRLSIRI